MKNWETKKLSEICEFSNGLWTGKKPPFQNVGVIRNTNFTKDGKLDDSDIVYLDVEQSQFAKRKLHYGDIILEKSGGGPKQPVGRVIIFDKKKGDYSFSNFTSVIRVINPKTVDFTYLHRFLFFSYLSGATETMQSHSTGIRNLKFDDYKDIEILLPSLPEQKRIVSILDQTAAVIAKAKANAEKNLKNAKELFESYLQGVFEGMKAKGQLSQLANYLDLITYGFTNPMPTADEGPFMVTAKNVKGGIVDYSTSRRTSQYAFDNLITDKCRPRKGDVLLTKDGTLGRLAVVEKADMCINQSVALLRPTKDLNSYYLKELLSSQFYQNLMVEQAGGATIKHIYITRVDKMLVPIPSIKEQLSIIQKIDALSFESKKLEAIYEKKINDLEELEKSVLQKAFSGKLKTEKAVIA